MAPKGDLDQIAKILDTRGPGTLILNLLDCLPDKTNIATDSCMDNNNVAEVTDLQSAIYF